MDTIWLTNEFASIVQVRLEVDKRNPRTDSQPVPGDFKNVLREARQVDVDGVLDRCEARLSTVAATGSKELDVVLV